MKFDAAWCPFEVVWRFPEGLLGGALAQQPGFEPTCEGSLLSPFALGCDLNGPTRLGSSAYTLRSELHVMASGSDVIRRIGFVDDWASDPIAVPPPKDCPLVPLQYDESTQQRVANLRLLPEFAWFDETESKLEQPALGTKFSGHGLTLNGLPSLSSIRRLRPRASRSCCNCAGSTLLGSRRSSVSSVRQANCSRSSVLGPVHETWSAS